MATLSKKDQEQLQKKIRAQLAALGGAITGEDDLIFSGDKFIIPENMKTVDKAIEFLKLWKKQQEEVHNFSRVFAYRPFDGAHAVKQVLLKFFGTRGMGKSWVDMFGQKHPPEQREIAVGPGELASVPWGLMHMPLFDGTMVVTMVKDAEFGALFQLQIECARKWEAHVMGFFDLVDRELRAHSIYKGKAINGADTPEFIPLDVDPDKVVYSSIVKRELSANVWSPIRHTEIGMQLGLPTKRAVLLEGDYGTGKTLAGGLTAQIAVNNGWTFIKCRPNKDSWQQVMSTARLYPPCVVFFEDIDTVASAQDKDTISELLDAFDGVDAKGAHLMAVLTTNHVEKIHKGMVRPGRLDAIIKFEQLDGPGVQALVTAAVPPELLADVIDWERVITSLEGYLPAFVKEATDRAIRYAMDRVQGYPQEITTDDLVAAAEGMQVHLEIMENAKEVEEPESLESGLRRLVTDVVDSTKIVDVGSEEPRLELKHPDAVKTHGSKK